MITKWIITEGVGFNPNGVRYIVTRGLLSPARVLPAKVININQAVMTAVY